MRVGPRSALLVSTLQSLPFACPFVLIELAKLVLRILGMGQIQTYGGEQRLDLGAEQNQLAMPHGVIPPRRIDRTTKDAIKSRLRSRTRSGERLPIAGVSEATARTSNPPRPARP